MKKLVSIILLLLLACSIAGAQDNKITVVDFYRDDKDITANTHGTIVLDETGDKCALIKIRTNQTGFSFSVGVLGIVRTEYKIGEIWLYVPYGVNRLSMFHETLAPLEYSFPESTQKAKTYIMILKANEVFDNVVEDDTKKGKLTFRVEPKNANIVLNAVPIPIDATGTGNINISYGRYTYRVTADNYYPHSDRVRINAKDSIQTIDIRLKPNYGWLNLNCPEGLEGATLYLDGIRLGDVDTDSLIVRSGSRTIRIVNPLYIPYEQEFIMEDSSRISLTANLIPNYGTVRINTAETAEIYSDNTLLGQGSWEGRLPVGTHTIESRAESHAPQSLQITVERDAPTAEYTLAPPTPIYGAIEISSTPEGADVYIDNQLQGQTPFIKTDVLIGKRQITLRSPNFSTLKDTATIVKDSIARKNYIMGNKIFVTIKSNPDSSRISIDGKEVGITPFADTLNAGSHNIKISNSRKYVPFNKKVIIDSDNTNLTFTLREDRVRNNEIYIEGILGYGNNFNYGGAIGGYLRNFNMEAGFTTGGESENIYWNPVNSENETATVTSYSPMNFWGKIGYGIPISGIFRITPQIGVQVTSLSEKTIGGGEGDQANSTSGLIACKLGIAVSNSLGFSFTPEYRFNVSSSEGYNTLAGLSEQIDKFNKGINAKFGVYFFF